VRAPELVGCSSGSRACYGETQDQKYRAAGPKLERLFFKRLLFGLDPIFGAALVCRAG